MDDDHYVVFENALGEIRYRPRLTDGRVLCKENYFLDEWQFTCSDWAQAYPEYYKSRKRAIRVSIRGNKEEAQKEAERVEKELKRFKEKETS